MVRCIVSKSGRAPPPPTGTAADPSGALHTSGAWSLMLLGALSRSPAGPYRRPSISRVIPLRLVQTLNLQRWNCNVLGVVWCVLLQTSSIQGVFRVDFCPVVTNVVNPSAFSVKMLVFGLRLTTFVTEVLARRCESCWFDDVCNVGRPLVARPGLAAAHGYRSLALPPPAGIGNLSRETGVAFAGEKKLFFVHFSVAVVLPVSMVAVWGRAVVPAVSYWPASVAAEVLLVSKLARGRVLCAKKFAQRTKNGPN